MACYNVILPCNKLVHLNTTYTHMTCHVMSDETVWKLQTSFCNRPSRDRLGGQYWFGLRLTSTGWSWLDHRPLERHYWASGEPGGGNCGILKSGDWESHDCSLQHSFICEIPASGKIYVLLQSNNPSDDEPSFTPYINLQNARIPKETCCTDLCALPVDIHVVLRTCILFWLFVHFRPPFNTQCDHINASIQIKH